MKAKNQKIKNKSFTLVEMLVAVGIFSIILVITSTILISAIKIQKKSLAMQELIDQTSYVMEYMSRTLRMAGKDLTGDCIAAKTNYAIPYSAPYSDSSIRFLNYEEKCQEFFVTSGGQIVESKSIDGTRGNLQSSIPLTSPDLNVALFKIGPDSNRRGWSQNADCVVSSPSEPPITVNCQPRVTIYLDINGKEGTNIKIQTTISQRELDVAY